MNKIYISDKLDPWHNLALEEYLMDNFDGSSIFYLWQNKHTVVIGRNQNAWQECNSALLEDDGGKLARRSSGGGAVYHDLGNLCFTFIVDNKLYDLERQLGVILSALRNLGIDAVFSGRNDLTVDGKKFSGNAFKRTKNVSLHHGTLLVNADLQNLGKYLTPPKHKLESKGIKSVKSRVCNLSEFRPLDIQTISDCLIDAFKNEYGESQHCSLPNSESFSQCYEKYSSWQWRYANTMDFDISFENAFEWGHISVNLALKSAVVESAQVFSDAMDEAFILSLAQGLEGAQLTKEGLKSAVLALKDMNSQVASDLCAWVETIDI